jgi:hypothetical protein
MRYAAVFLLLASCSTQTKTEKPPVDSASPSYDSAFWKTWSDGQAELTSYQLTGGTAVAIFVTETMAKSLGVKSDPGVRDKSGEVPVMKLNLIEDKSMLQSFVALAEAHGRPAGVAAKVTWSSQDWCGNLFKIARFDDGNVHVVSHSYLDGEGDQEHTNPSPAAAVLSEDALMLWARGMAWPVIKPGETKEVPALLALQHSRQKKGPSQWGTAKLTRTAKGDVDEAKAILSDGRTRTFIVEKAAPHRIVSYSSSEGIEAKRIATIRNKYWELSKPEGVEALKELGLKPAGK